MLDRLAGETSADVERLRTVANDLSVTRTGSSAVTGAYDIGSGGVDHVLGSGRDVNILVLDTQVYSNTAGRRRRRRPRGVTAKFAAAGKTASKKDLGLEALSYGDVYVAQIALGGSDVQTVKALLEADAWPGPSLVIAYASCVPAHGFDDATRWCTSGTRSTAGCGRSTGTARRPRTTSIPSRSTATTRR